MDANEVTNHLDSDALLPPRKRLLAGLKRQSCSESTSQSHSSQENNPSPSPSPVSPNPLREFDVRLNNLLKSYKNGSIMSPAEIAKAAGLAAEVAAKAAENARASAEEKAAIAAKAVAAAKNALNLVSSISEETSTSRDNRNLRKNRTKKHVVPVQFLYKKNQPSENCGTGTGTDEELARRLHRAINSSPRISKNSPGSSDSKNHKNKKRKISQPISNVRLPLECNGDFIDREGSNDETHSDKIDEKASKSRKLDEAEVDSSEAQSSQHSKVKSFEPSEDTCINGRKRGGIKQKKLPLSICSFKDQTNPKEVKLTKSTPIKVTSTWKCQDFKVSQCVNQDKFVQS